jgi:hypothetical protein
MKSSIHLKIKSGKRHFRHIPSEVPPVVIAVSSGHSSGMTITMTGEITQRIPINIPINIPEVEVLRHYKPALFNSETIPKFRSEG